MLLNIQYISFIHSFYTQQIYEGKNKMIVVVGNIKGGVGKTTLAVNIAIARALDKKDVLLVDGDEQGTAAIFNRIRNSDESTNKVDYTFSQLHGADVRTEIQKQKVKYDDVIIDVGGRDTLSLRAALTIADKLIIPVLPRSFDIWAIAEISKLIEEAKIVNDNLRSFCVLNLADSQGRDNDDTEEYLADFKQIEVLPVRIGRRKAFPNAASNGKSVLECSAKIDEKATRELNDFVASIYTQ